LVGFGIDAAKFKVTKSICKNTHRKYVDKWMQVIIFSLKLINCIKLSLTDCKVNFISWASPLQSFE
jgi:hypothetical protein